MADTWRQRGSKHRLLNRLWLCLYIEEELNGNLK